MEEYLELAQKYGLTGPDALKYATEQKEKADERAERAAVRDKEKEEREKERKHELELERLRTERDSLTEHSQAVSAKKPKLPAFVDGKDDLDAYLARFERTATNNDWPREQWATNLCALLTGQALNVYSRLSEREANDYGCLKEALQQRYGLTAEGYRRKLRESDPDPDESPAQYLERLTGYLRRWVKLADADIEDLIIHEQFMAVCPKSLQTHLRERVDYDLKELGEQAAKFLEAHGRSLSSLVRRPGPKGDSLQPLHNQSVTSASALPAAIQDGCVFCGFPHPSEECRKTRDLTPTERRERVLRRGGCFWCLKMSFHRAADCRQGKPRCSVCNGRHHPLLCDRPPSVTAATGSRSDNGVGVSSTQPVTVTTASRMASERRNVVLMQTATVDASGLKGKRRVRVMCDSGSNTTFIRSDTAQMLGCRVVAREPLSVSTFGGGQAAHQVSAKVQVALAAKNGSVLQMTAYKIPSICDPPPVISRDQLQQYDHLRGLTLAEEPGGAPADGDEIEILIGQDYLQDVFDSEMRVGQSGPMAINSKFGWILCGRSNSAFEAQQPMMTNFVRTETVKATLDDLWTLEGIGISSEGVGDGNGKKQQEIAALEHFNETCTRLPDGRYQNRWPWKPDTESLPSNETMALSRLKACERQLLKTGGLRQYDDAIQDYIDQGHAEEAPQVANGRVHVLPHHAVFKNGKIRVVFDAAAGHPNSLNDHILSGPNLIADLTGVLLRFRLRMIGVTADIEKAFLQLALHPDDRDVTRFLWRKNASDIHPTTYRMTRVVFGVSASPFMLQASVRRHLQQYEKSDGPLIARLRRDLYCDDLITSVDTPQEAEELSRRSKEIFSDAKMNMRHWTSSFQGETEKPKILGELGAEERKVLGICWNPSDDRLVFRTACLTQFGREALETKRNILSVAARFFDPLGLLTPFSVRVKLLLKSLWTAELSWDQPAASDICKDWRKWLSELEKIDGFSIPRPYSIGSKSGYQLHMFCDASKEAFAAVVYLRPEDGICAPALVMAKARLTPRQAISVPRLELTAALIGARLVNYVKDQLDIHTEMRGCWTDSMVALHWARSDPQRWGVFVRNRVNEIQRLCPPSFWKYCPGSQNPADLPSKGVPAAQLRSDLWLHGPEWLGADSAVWPPQPPVSQEPAECLVEAKKQALTTTGARTESTSVGQVMDINRYGDWNKVMRVTAWMLRWAPSRRSEKSPRGPLSSDEINAAERLWIMDAQEAEYGQELEALRAGLELPRQTRLKSLNPALSEGILRKGGRLQHSDLSEEEMRPVILPPNHRLADLLVMKTHQQLCHAGVQQTLYSTRDRYWIVRGRQVVRASLNRCPRCHLFRAQPFAMRPAPLPRSRVTAARPFSRTGVDFAGPLFVKQSSGHKPGKVYVALFTCAVTRAIHLELVGSLRTEDFIRAYRRFAARRLSPTSILSDNATYFKAAAAALATEGVSWSFIVERAPWWGGFWESMVKLTKHALRRTLGGALLSWEELETVLCSVEAAINERPLTVVNDDPDDQRPLRPADFLSCSLESGHSPVRGSEAQQLTRRRRYQSRVTDILWSRWQREYLRQLRDQPPPQAELAPALGDLVLIEGESSPNRLTWTTGIICAVHPGRDGRPRAATVRTVRGEVRRPIQKLYLLEAASAREPRPT